MEKTLEKSKGRMENVALQILKKFGDLTLNNCCILAMYEPKIPEELMSEAEAE
jgi:cyclic lactone autoinducer peptide